MTCGRKTKKVGPKKKPVCPECKTVFENRKLFRKHYKDQHQNSAYKCSRCLKTYKLRKTYMAHLNSHNEMFLSKFQCDLCDYKGVDTWNLKRHKVTKHNAANWSPEPDSTAEQQLESLNIAYRNRVMTVNDEATEPNNNEIIDDQSIRSADHTDIEENDELEDNNKEADTSAADQNQSDNEIHEHVVPKPKQLSRYEQIRLDIITERDQMLADSGLLDEIHAAKQDLSPPKRVKTKVPNEHSKNLPVRRSGRNCLSDSNCSISKPSESHNISNNSRSDEIKLEIKVELVEATEDSFGDEAEKEAEEAPIETVVDQIIDDLLSKAVRTDSEKFKCKKCDYSARDNHNLQRHMEVMHSKLVIKCLKCAESFFEKALFIKHNPDCTYKCTFNNCSKTFIKKSRFDAHLRMHYKMISRY